MPIRIDVVNYEEKQRLAYTRFRYSPGDTDKLKEALAWIKRQFPIVGYYFEVATAEAKRRYIWQNFCIDVFDRDRVIEFLLRGTLLAFEPHDCDPGDIGPIICELPDEHLGWFVPGGWIVDVSFSHKDDAMLFKTRFF
jgi:hypothetical protein